MSFIVDDNHFATGDDIYYKYCRYFIVIVDHRIVVGDSSEIFGFRDQDPSYARSPFKPVNVMEIQIVIKAMMMMYYFKRLNVSSSQRDGFR